MPPPHSSASQSGSPLRPDTGASRNDKIATAQLETSPGARKPLSILDRAAQDLGNAAGARKPLDCLSSLR